MATLAIVDDADGTGATATIAGSVGATNSVYVSKATGAVGGLSFTLAGSRVGDGTISLIVAKGLWWGYLLSDGAFSGLVYFASTDGEDAVATRLRQAVADTIALLPIPPAVNIYQQAYPDHGNVKFPCVLVSTEGVQETDERGLSTRDDIGRPVKVQIADRANKHDHTKLPLWEKWREAISRCFVSQQVAGVPESKICRIEPYLIIDPNLPQYEWMVSGLVVRCICREPRGVGA